MSSQTAEGKHSVAKRTLLSFYNMQCFICPLSNSPIFPHSVDSEEVKFYAQKELIELSVLKHCCFDAFRLFGIRHINLPEYDPEVFEHLLDYLYRGNYITAARNKGADNEDEAEAELLAKIFVTTDKYDLYFRESGTRDIELPENDPLRRYLLEKGHEIHYWKN